MLSLRNSTWVCWLVSALAACGGGGPGGGDGDDVPHAPPDSQVTVPATLAMANFVNQAKSSQMTINGTLTVGGQSFPFTGAGTLTESSDSATFEGQSALRKNSEMRGTLSVNGETRPLSSSSQLYFDTGYGPMGSTGEEAYCVVSYANALPASAKAGDSGPWYAENCYTDSTKRVSIGTDSISYSLEADTATSLLLNVLQRMEEPGGARLSGISTFRVETSGQIDRVRQASTSEYGGDSFIMTIIYH